MLFGKGSKVPNMQIGDRNMMHINHPFEDSDEDDGMFGSSYDKSYKPPGE